MTAIIEFNRLPGGHWEVQRVHETAMYFTITMRGGEPVVVNPQGETVFHVAELAGESPGTDYKILGELRFEGFNQ